MKDHSDFQLTSMAVNGNDDAFRCLVERHCQTVFNVAFKWCGVREDAEDIAQDVMMQLADKIRIFKPHRAAFTTWLYKVTINAAKDARRKQRTRQDYEGNFAGAQRLQTSISPQEENLAQGEAIDFLDRLPDKEKEVILLTVSEGLSHKEAAKVVGCAETTVSWRMHNARKKLRKWMN
jgi:RNA polymerase sigma-70 factor (ECF subfamily)